MATPPNAIVFGTGYVTIPQMAKAVGFILASIGSAVGIGNDLLKSNYFA